MTNWTLSGYKTYIGAAGVIIVAVGKAMIDYYNGLPVDVAALLTQLSAGLGILGIGAKLHSK